MAFIPLSTSTTLAQLKANVRSQTGALSAQESELFELQLNDIVHNAILFIRNFLGKILDDFYSTTQTVTESSNLIDISGIAISDVNKLTLYDSSHGLVPFVESHLFYALQSVYSSSQLADAVFATVSNILATDNKLQIRTFRGTNKATPGTLTVVYPRIPQKATSDSAKLDIPDAYVPLVQDVSTLYVLRKLNRPVEPALENRVTSTLNAFIGQLGLELSPKRAE